MMSGVYRAVQMMSSYSVENMKKNGEKKKRLRLIISLHSMLIYYTKINVIK